MSASPSPRRRLATAAVVTAAAVAAAVVIQPDAEAARPSAYRVTGVDTSHHNHDDGEGGETAPIDWRRVAGSRTFAFLKATQHTSYVDPWFARDWRDVSATSLLRAPYHFFDPRGTGDGAAQAGHFIRTVRAAGYTGTRPGELPPVLDVEKVPGGRKGKEVCPSGLRADQIRAFADRVEAEFGVKPIIYTRASFVNECMGGDGTVFAGYPLWLARYESGAMEPAAVPGAPQKWTFWQYTEHGRVPGIRTKADLDVFDGTADQLRRMARPSSAPGRGAVPAAPGAPVTPGAPAAPARTWPLLREGARGADVETLQHLLTARGHRTAVDGVFGADTAAKVRAFQKAAGIGVDGVAGPDTWAALVVTVRAGDRGQAVTAVQKRLTAAGHQVAVDGVFGADTAAKVRAFQKAAGIGVDGVAGPDTWAALLGS